MTNERYKKNPGKFGPKSVIGVYLRAMNMTQYRDLTFADSDKIGNSETESTPVPIDEEYEEDLLQKLNAGEITQEQYNTLTKTNSQTLNDLGGGTSFVDENGFISSLKNFAPATDEIQIPQLATPQEQTPQYQIDSDYWVNQLDDSDIDYLMLK